MAEPTTEDAQAQPAPEAGGVDVEEASLPEAEGGVRTGPGGQIDVLLDTTLSIEVRLGRIDVRARDLLGLGAGSVLQLDKRAGEPVDLYLRGNHLATAQLVVVGERLGVRIKQIVPADAHPGGDDEAA